MALTPEQQNVLKLIELHTEPMPVYVQEYILSKKRAGLSPNTLLQYLYRYHHFFDWMLSEGWITAENYASIPYSALETIKKETVEFYLDFLKEENISKDESLVETRGAAVIDLSIHALKSLFNYLTKETEKEDGECYFYRNVMSKIVLHTKRETANRRARSISSVILNDVEIRDYLHFIEFEYADTLESEQQKRSFKRDKLRDLAINDLILGTGMRVGEVASIELKKINFKKGTIDIVRKGGTEDTVLVLESTLYTLKQYVKSRTQFYPKSESTPFLFVTNYNGSAIPLSRKSIQNIVKKYTAAFSHDAGISPHKLRHSFAVDFLRNGGGDIVLLRDQLGHTDIKTTALYTNMSEQDSMKVLNKMDENR